MNDELDSDQSTENNYPDKAIKVIPGSELEAIIKKMLIGEITNTNRIYTTLDVVLRDGCHAAVARPM